MTDKTGCECGAAPQLIFPCSGGSDVGAVSDRTARRLTEQGVGKMFCLAGIGGRVSDIMKTTEAAAGILAIDGCPLDCAKKCLEQAGFSDVAHVRISDLGMEKGQSPVAEASINRVVDAARELLSDQR